MKPVAPLRSRLIVPASRRRFLGLVAGAAAATLGGRRAAWAAGLPEPAFGLCVGLERAGFVKENGGDFVETGVADFLNPDGPEEEFLKRLEQIAAAPLPMPVCNGFIRRPDLKCTGPAANHEAVLAYVSAAFERARRAGVKTIVFGSSGARKRPQGWSAKQADEQFVALLKKMGPLAAKAGVTVALEPLNRGECNYINRIGEVAAIAAAVGHPAVMGVADLYHMVREGDTPADLAAAMPHVHHVEIAEAEGRSLPRPGGQDFTPFFKVLRAKGFAGTISMEGRWKDPDIAPAFAEMRRQWQAAG
jgi:sugar phosphate isomerase/epimerase